MVLCRTIVTVCPLQRSSSAQVLQGAEESSSHWDSPDFERLQNWPKPAKPVSQDPALRSFRVDRCFQVAYLKGRLQKTPLCITWGLFLPSFLQSGFLLRNLSFPKGMPMTLFAAEMVTYFLCSSLSGHNSLQCADTRTSRQLLMSCSEQNKWAACPEIGPNRSVWLRCPTTWPVKAHQLYLED